MNRRLPEDWLIPNWPVPQNVVAVSTSRSGGVSGANFRSLNLSDRVGDDPASVEANRAKLCASLSLPTEPAWLWQVHGKNIVDAGRVNGRIEADASLAFSPDSVCVVTTADCLPVLFCDRKGTRIAAAHAGWRGLVAGVLEATIEALEMPSEQVIAWLGPAIGPRRFEVGDEVKAAFVAQEPTDARAFTPSAHQRWFADIYQLATNRLRSKGVQSIHGGGWCTYSDPKRFFSFRRDRETGRMASLIWMSKPR